MKNHVFKKQPMIQNNIPIFNPNKLIFTSVCLTNSCQSAPPFFVSSRHNSHRDNNYIWPHRGGSQRREPSKNFFEISTKKKGHGIGVFLTDLHHILHARSCMHFQCFPHARWPHRPLKRPQN